MAYVEQSGRGWRARWPLGDGRYGSKSGFAGKRAAQQYADEQELAVRRWPRLRVEPGLSVGEWWQRWFPAQDLAPATLENYAQQYRRHVHPRFGRRALAEITSLNLSEFARDLRGSGLAPSSVTVVLSVIRDLLADAAAEGLIPAAPPLLLRHRRTGAGAPVRPGVVVGVETVLALCTRLAAQEALMAVTALFTGMRWGEICGMRRRYLHGPGEPGGLEGAWYRVDAMCGTVHEDVHAYRFFGPPKGGGGRSIDLPGFLADLLAEHCAGAGGRDLLFVNRRGAPIRHTDFRARWRKACDGASGGPAPAPFAPVCPGLRFHDLRHSHKTMLVELGVPEALQDERLGHRPRGAHAVYDHTTTAMRKPMIGGLERIWADALARVRDHP